MTENKQAGEAQGANQAPPRPDQPPDGSVCAPGGTARLIVPQTGLAEKRVVAEHRDTTERHGCHTPGNKSAGHWAARP